MKNTSRFMMKFKSSQKKKKEKEAKEKAAANGGKKPTYMLLRLGGGNSNKRKGGFFRGLFKKQDGTSDDFKNSSVLLGKVAAATNWLTKRFLSKKMQENSTHRGLGGRRGNPQHSSSRRFLHGYHNNGYEFEEEDDGYGQHHVVAQRDYRYDDGYGDYGVESEPGYGRQGQYGFYDNEMGGADYQDLGYYEEDVLYDPNGEYYDDGLYEYNDPYSSAQGYYDTQEANYYGQISPPASPMVSPVLHRRVQSQRSPSPLARAPSPPHSPRASIIRRSPPPLERGPMRHHSPLSSPHVSMRMQGLQSSPTPARSPFGGRKMQEPPPLSPGLASPPLSPQLSRKPSPSPSHRSLSPAGPRPAPSSPTLSRRSTRLLRDPTPLARPRALGNVPLGTVRPSPMGLRGRPVPPPTQNVRPFRASSVRSNRSSVLTIDSLHSSPFHSPLMVQRAPLARRESGRLPLRPIARGRPLRAQQSIRRMPPPSPQPSMKHMSRSPSPHLSPQLNRQSYISDPYADSYTERSQQFVAPSSPRLSRSLQNQGIQPGAFSVLRTEAAQMAGMGQMASELVEPCDPAVQRPMSTYEQPLLPPSQMLSGALQNQAVREASYIYPLQRPQSPHVQSVPSSPLLSGAMRHSQAIGGVASYQTPQLQSPYGPTVVMPYDYISEPGPAPLLQDALQNQTGFALRSNTEPSQFVVPSSPMLSHYLQKQGIRPDTISALGPEAAQMMGMGQMAPELVEPHDHTLQRPMSPYEQPLLPPSQMLSGALQNQAVREASYVSPLQRPQSPYAPSVPSSPLLSGAMRHSQAMRGMASYQTPQMQSPYGPSLGTPYDYISEPGPAPLLQDALQNQTGLHNVSNLKSPIMQRRNPYAPAGPQLHNALQQNPNLRQASFQTPVQLRQSSVVPQSPSSPMLGRALQNPQLMQASYRLPERTLISPYTDPRSSPLLGHALQNQQLRSASYIMPDGSVIRVSIKFRLLSQYVCQLKVKFYWKKSHRFLWLSNFN
ncbi:hypothetical protein XENOCAPTIV_028323 [Xenoophorus captivus]|uniref:Uncharacterized protein n=1 Tax=Xenoophorus captivus TaxID=1517983 RepID=A0ABV0RDW6_9TELE